jgi:hypothetical protein
LKFTYMWTQTDAAGRLNGIDGDFLE